MRAIESIEQKKKREHTQKVIVMSVMLGLLLLSSAGFAFSFALGDREQTNPTDNPNDQNVAQKFKYSQEETANISVDVNLASFDYQSQNVYLVVDDDDEALRELTIGLSDYSAKLQEACYGPCSKDLPEKGCNELLIVTNGSLKERVYQNQSCVFIDGGIKAIDAFLYNLSG